jgi:uncharacterized membrane protein
MLPFLHYYFAPVKQPWWAGNIYGNLLASVLCGIAVFIASRYLLKLLKKQHKEHIDLLKEHHAILSAEIDTMNNNREKQNV